MAQYGGRANGRRNRRDTVEIEHWDTERDGVLSETTLRRKRESRDYRVTRYVYAPGTVFPAHRHAVDKIDAVLAGRFRIVIAGREWVLGPGDCRVVPKLVVHAAAVVGDTPVVSRDAVRA
jgi:mannose-6-phosphate isomerase-like protein (cupin superfamily)